VKNPRRGLIVFDGEMWHVRNVAVIQHDLDADELVYRCNKPIKNDLYSGEEALRRLQKFLRTGR
jgi:hypothetical protein